jgi:DNA-binding MarR family transcriptional regulator
MTKQDASLGVDNRLQKADLDHSATHLLHRAVQCASEVFTVSTQSVDITPRQYAVMLAVAQNERISQIALTGKTGIDRSTMADVVRRLVNRGLLRRARSRQDSRAYELRLTDEGWRVLEGAVPKAMACDEQVLSALPEEERSTFLRQLALIVAAWSSRSSDSSIS